MAELLDMSGEEFLSWIRGLNRGDTVSGMLKCGKTIEWLESTVVNATKSYVTIHHTGKPASIDRKVHFSKQDDAMNIIRPLNWKQLNSANKSTPKRQRTKSGEMPLQSLTDSQVASVLDSLTPKSSTQNSTDDIDDESDESKTTSISGLSISCSSRKRSRKVANGSANHNATNDTKAVELPNKKRRLNNGTTNQLNSKSSNAIVDFDLLSSPNPAGKAIKTYGSPPAKPGGIKMILPKRSQHKRTPSALKTRPRPHTNGSGSSNSSSTPRQNTLNLPRIDSGSNRDSASGVGDSPAFNTRANKEKRTMQQLNKDISDVERRDGTPELRSVVGLRNLGNTCFMNSTLQALMHTRQLSEYFLSTRFKDALNRDNPIGHGGRVAMGFYKLLRSAVENTGGGYYGGANPLCVHSQLGGPLRTFGDYRQHDAQEFLTNFLDGLHEDLNRIKKKPYIEIPDFEDFEEKITETVSATEAQQRFCDLRWQIHKKRNDSVICDLFTGMLRSTVVCPECEYVSITFDPFEYLLLPIRSWKHHRERMRERQQQRNAYHRNPRFNGSSNRYNQSRGRGDDYKELHEEIVEIEVVYTPKDYQKPPQRVTIKLTGYQATRTPWSNLRILLSKRLNKALDTYEAQKPSDDPIMDDPTMPPPSDGSDNDTTSDHDVSDVEPSPFSGRIRRNHKRTPKPAAKKKSQTQPNDTSKKTRNFWWGSLFRQSFMNMQGTYRRLHRCGDLDRGQQFDTVRVNLKPFSIDESKGERLIALELPQNVLRAEDAREKYWPTQVSFATGFDGTDDDDTKTQATPVHPNEHDLISFPRFVWTPKPVYKKMGHKEGNSAVIVHMYPQLLRGFHQLIESICGKDGMTHLQENATRNPKLKQILVEMRVKPGTFQDINGGKASRYDRWTKFSGDYFVRNYGFCIDDFIKKNKHRSRSQSSVSARLEDEKNLDHYLTECLSEILVVLDKPLYQHYCDHQRTLEQSGVHFADESTTTSASTSSRTKTKKGSASTTSLRATHKSHKKYVSDDDNDNDSDNHTSTLNGTTSATTTTAAPCDEANASSSALSTRSESSTDLVGPRISSRPLPTDFIPHIADDSTVSTLQQCFGLFLAKERLDANNPWYCKRCQEHREATKKLDLWSLPKHLIVAIKRFDAHGYRKVNTPVDFPDTGLDLSYLIHGTQSTDESASTSELGKYDLYAVVNHSGSLNFGHYTANVKFDGKWHHVSDSSVGPGHKAFRSSREQAYIMFYKRRSC